MVARLFNSARSTRVLTAGYRSAILYSPRWSRLISGEAAQNTPGPETTDYYSLDVCDEETFGEGRTQSARLAAASWRIAEHLMVYDAMEQSLLEHEEELSFGSVEREASDGAHGANGEASKIPTQPQTKAAGYSYAEKVQTEPTSAREAARQYLFSKYSGPVNSYLTEYMDAAEIKHAHAARRSSPEEVSQMLEALFKQDPQKPGFLQEMARIIAQRGVLPQSMTDPTLGELVRRGYLTPAQTVLDSLIMSRGFLGWRVLVRALEVATAAQNADMFYKFFRLAAIPARVPPPGHISNAIQPRWDEDREFLPVRDARMRQRFLSSALHRHKHAVGIIDAVARGLLQFGDGPRMDRLVWLANKHDLLSGETVLANLRLAERLADKQRVSWTWSRMQKLRIDGSPEALRIVSSLGLSGAV